MDMIYITGFSTEGVDQSMSGTFAGFVATVASGLYAHQSFESILGTGNFSEFAAAVQAALNAAGGGPWTVTYSTTTGLYTISRAAIFTVAWTGDPGYRLTTALGFNGVGLSGANTYTSTLLPYYQIVPEEAARSDYSDDYEPADIVEEAVSDGGDAYAVAKDTDELWCDWEQTMEPYEAVFFRNESTVHPWSWQSFFKHLRSDGVLPFAVYDFATFESLLYSLRADGASFKPMRVTTDLNTQWNIPFATRSLGELT